MRRDKSHKGLGYDIRIQREGSWWMNEKHEACMGIDGELPPEWEQVKQEPDVVKAVIFRAHQRHVRADKRRIIDRYEPEA